MAHSFKHKDQVFKVGDTVDMMYRVVEGAKERLQKFNGIIIKVRGTNDANRMFTIRKITRSGIGVERIVPLMSPFVSSLTTTKKTTYNKAKAYFIRTLSDQELRRKLYRKR